MIEEQKECIHKYKIIGLQNLSISKNCEICWKEIIPRIALWTDWKFVFETLQKELPKANFNEINELWYFLTK